VGVYACILYVFSNIVPTSHKVFEPYVVGHRKKRVRSLSDHGDELRSRLGQECRPIPNSSKGPQIGESLGEGCQVDASAERFAELEEVKQILQNVDPSRVSSSDDSDDERHDSDDERQGRMRQTPSAGISTANIYTYIHFIILK